ncbi:peptidoglycan-binding protein [Streptomyces sp. TP-A0356]|uniref:peptidoglycan-binding domain-containing protein n=1 Tax=Streptomyces sp. TP-A0356 TaxID=1359208 RepID=UPI0006E29BDE|nr:peptidoglycan-binding domain-containing protein [Streptomyces sp. TP-A0356]
MAAVLAGAAQLVVAGSADAVTPTSSAALGCHWAHGLPTEILELGSTGSCVEYLQGKLAVTVDGTFGRRTYNAVVATQEHCKLHVDGIVGPKTWDAILYWCRE